MLRFHHREPDVDRDRLVIVILDLGIGQGGLLDHRPHDRLGALVEPAIHDKLADLAGDLRFRREGHRQVRLFPVTGDAEPLEFLGLDIDPFLGELTAFLAELDDRDSVLVETLFAVLFLDLPLDRQTVTVPAGHVVRVLAEHLLRAVDDVLQHLVERMAHMQVAVRVGRAVMQDELLGAGAALAQLLPEADLFPMRQNLRLTGRQVAAHREVGLRQKDGRLIVHAHRFSLLAGTLVARAFYSDSVWRAASASRAICALSSSRPLNFISGRIKSMNCTRSCRP